MLAPNFKLLIKTFIQKDGKYICIQRSEKDTENPNKWDLPGGNLKFRENIEKALKREVFEETGLKIKKLTPFYVNTFMKNKIFFVVIIYLSEYLSGKIKLSDEHQNVKILDISKLKDLDFQNWILPTINKLDKINS